MAGITQSKKANKMKINNSLETLSSEELYEISGGQVKGSYSSGYKIGKAIRDFFSQLADAISNVPDGLYSEPKY